MGRRGACRPLFESGGQSTHTYTHTRLIPTQHKHAHTDARTDKYCLPSPRKTREDQMRQSCRLVTRTCASPPPPLLQRQIELVVFPPYRFISFYSRLESTRRSRPSFFHKKARGFSPPPAPPPPHTHTNCLFESFLWTLFVRRPFLPLISFSSCLYRKCELFVFFGSLLSCLYLPFFFLFPPPFFKREGEEKKKKGQLRTRKEKRVDEQNHARYVLNVRKEDG